MTDLLSRVAALSPEQRALLESRVAELAARGAGQRERIVPRDRSRPTPLSYAQQREWALERFRPSNNISGAVRLEGEVDLDLLSRVLTEVLARHEVLRSTVEIVDRVPVQVVHPVTPIPVEVIDLSDLDPEQQRVEVRRRYDAEVVRPFPPEQPHRMRGVALRLGPQEYVALTTIHHASSDGWSMAIVLREVTDLYSAFRAGKGSPLPPLPIQYGDFAVWQREQLGEAWMAAELAYWRGVLDGMPPRLALPTDRPYPVRRTFAGAHHAVVLGREATHALQRFGENESASISMIMLAVCSVVLHRYTDQDDLVFGTAITGRVRTETERVVGCFANALPLRLRLSRDQSLREVLYTAREVVSAAFDHQDIPFDRLIEELAPKETSQTPLIQMMINVLTAPGSILRLANQVLELPGLRVTPVPMDPGPVPIDIIVAVQALPEAVHLQWHYSTELFDAQTIVRLAGQVERVLDQLVRSPDIRVGEVDLLDTGGPTIAAQTVSTGEAEVGSGEVGGSASAGLVELFQAQAAGAPDLPAVSCDGVATSFGELNRQANQLAHQLRRLGVTGETRVGILLERSPLLAAAIVGVLKAGGCFVPLDPQLPADRIGYMLTDAAATVLVTTGELAALAAGASPAHTLLVGGADPLPDGADDDPPGLPALSSAAYVVYTSGSTGQPKGVVVEHASLVAFAREVAQRLQLGGGDRFLQFASPGFDVLVEELFPVWLAGGAVVIPPPKQIGPGLDLVELAERERISVMELPAAYWHEWVRELDRTGRALPSCLRLVIVGAERVLPERLAMWQKLSLPLMHVYGITETTVSSTFFRLAPNAPPGDLAHLPIGTALPSVRLHILDAELRPVPTGGVGELYLGGVGVARGYLNQPALTAQRFVADPDPAHPGGRVYRSGDLVRQRSDGNLEFVARVDTQIKIRGFRVEPAEIESAMCRHPQVAQAVVRVHEKDLGDRRLVAYLVPQARTRPNLTDLRRFLARELPPYLVPAAFVQLEALPLTANGKVDHDLLPEPSNERPELVEELIAPQTPLEQQLAHVVAAVLGVTMVGANDNFFELGGDSILAIQVVARAQEEGIGLSPLDLFEHPTVAQLAKAATNTNTERVVRRRPPDADPVLSFDQERLWLEDQLVPGAAYNVGGRQRLVGPLNVAILEASIRAILVRHEALRSRFPTVNGQPVQVVDDLDGNWRLRIEDLTGVNGDRADLARRLMDEQATTGFDLAKGPLFKCLLIKLSDTEHLISITSHHIVADLASVGLFARELSAVYEAGGEVDRADLPELPVQYRDYAVWQRGWLVGETLEREVGYWRGHLAGAPPALALPTWAPSQGAAGGRLRSALSESETVAFNELCRKHGVTSFMVVLASLATVLSRWSGQRDVVVGVSISSRTDASTENLIGPFINTLPLRVRLSGDPTFAELLDRVRQVALDGYAHADAPLDLLVKQMQVTRDPRRTPLFQVMLNVVDIPPVEHIGDVALEPVEVPALPSSFDLVLTAQEVHGVLHYTLEFNADRYQAAMMQILAGHLGTLLRAVVDDPTRGILDYSFQSADDATGRESSSVDRPASAPYLAVERQAQLSDRVAVIDRGGEWSYRWLNQAATRVAQVLAQRSSPHADHLAVVRRPTAAFVAAVLGGLKTGATVSVIEANAPVPAHHLGVSTESDASPTSEAAEATIDLSDLFRDQADPLLAGPVPTGQEGSPAPTPAAPTDDWAVEQFRLGGEDRFTVLSGSSGLLLSALSSAFCAGATLVIPEQSLTGDISTLTTWLQTNAISVVYASPPILRRIAARSTEPQLPTLRYVFVDHSGELISHDIDAWRRLSPTSQCVAVYRVGRDGRPLAMYAVPDDWQLQTAPVRVPLGTELAGTPARLRHSSGQSAAIGEVAELCFGSYRTGDLGRRWADGTLEFVGKLGTDARPREEQVTT